MTNRYEAHEFRLIDPLDESLLQTLNAEPGASRGAVITLIKEYLCRRGRRCSLCGKGFNRRDLTIDRRRPISHGGKDNIENLQLLCYECSALKGGGTMLDIRKKIRAQKPQQTNKRQPTGRHR